MRGIPRFRSRATVIGTMSRFKTILMVVCVILASGSLGVQGGNAISGSIPQITKSEGEQTAVLAGQAYLDGVTFALRIAGAGMVLAGAVSFPLLGSRGRVRKTDAAPTVVEPPEYS